MVLGHLVSIYKIITLDPLPHTIYRKVNLTWIKDLNVRAKTLKMFKENIGVSLRDLRIGRGIFRCPNN